MNASICYSFASSVQRVRCEAGWKRYDDTCYVIRPSRATYDDAIGNCSLKGAALLLITSAVQEAYIRSIKGSTRAWVDCRRSSNTSNGWSCGMDNKAPTYLISKVASRLYVQKDFAHPGHCLRNHVIMEMEGSVVECASTCLLHNGECRSMNIWEANNTCQLNSVPRTAASHDYRKSSGCQYFDILSID
ncbi:uncharacterized protein [Diadema setosum]|uniref:uncharacterized protein n=1 Tax=Diadema setosum TaxID=31175 RepID=UPI003B3B07BE